MKLINTEKAPGAIGPYSQGFEVNGVIYTSGQIPVNPENGEIPEGIAAQAEQSWKLQAVALGVCLRLLVFWQIWEILERLMRYMGNILYQNRREAVWRSRHCLRGYCVRLRLWRKSDAAV